MAPVLSIGVVALLALLGVGHAAVPTVPLHNAAEEHMTMPLIGIGTGGYGNASDWGGEHWNDTVAEAAVSTFLRVGGRRIDTSLQYYTQIGCGRAWTNSGIPREQIFITSKCDSPLYGMVPGGYDETVASVQLSLQQLQTDYIDLMLIHWPGLATAPKTPPPCWSTPNNWTQCRADTWRALLDLQRNGTLKAVGVSNYAVKHLKELVDAGGPLPSVNQIENHPYFHQDDIIAFCKAHNILVNSYAPLGTPDHMAYFPDRMPVVLTKNPDVINIAHRVGKTPAQVLARWALMNGIVVNPRSENEQHMRDNIGATSFDLPSWAMQVLSNLNTPSRNVCQDPSQIP